MKNMKIITDLERTKATLLQYFELPETDLQKQYGIGKWTAKEVLHHIVDAETVMYDRVRRIISEPRQVIWAFRQDDWCKHLGYKKFPLEINKAIFMAVRMGVIHLAGQFYESHGSKEFVHSETGVRTLKDEFDKIVWHCEHHLKQIEIALNH